MARARVTLAYRGTGFHGFAEQPEVETIAGRLRPAIEEVLRHPVEVVCAGRTDTGVHARMQVVSFDTDAAVDLQQLVRRVNKRLAPSIVLREACFVDADFSARFSATGRRYRYRILNSAIADPFRSDLSWWVPEELDLAEMNRAAHALVGEHNFAAYCRRPNADASLVRRVHDAHWSQTDEDKLLFEIGANAFCHQMVRSIVGHLVEIGRGRRAADAVPNALTTGARSDAGPLAPPHGLTLWEVLYS